MAAEDGILSRSRTQVRIILTVKFPYKRPENLLSARRLYCPGVPAWPGSSEYAMRLALRRSCFVVVLAGMSFFLPFHRC